MHIPPSKPLAPCVVEEREVEVVTNSYNMPPKALHNPPSKPLASCVVQERRLFARMTSPSRAQSCQELLSPGAAKQTYH